MPTRKHVLVRRCMDIAPDGNSVHYTDTVTVTIEWPGRDPNSCWEKFQRPAGQYYSSGEWVVADAGVTLEEKA